MRDRSVHLVASGFEVARVATILLVSLGATVQYVRRAIAADWVALLPRYRADLGCGVLLGLELLVAADVVGTVAVKPGFGSLGVLALVIIIRTFLSISFGVEIEGRWPWRRLEAEQRSSAGTGISKPLASTSCGSAEVQ